MVEGKIENLIKNLEKKEGYLIKLLKATKEQSMVIKEDNMDKLESILDLKSEYIDQIDILDVEFLSVFNEIKKETSIETMDQIDKDKYPKVLELKDKASRIYSILEEMSIIDKNNTKLMELNLEKVKTELKDVKDVKKAYKGYHYEPNVSILLDEKK